MTPTLPSKPNLEQLKKLAKNLQLAHGNGDASCCETLRHHASFVGASDEQILRGKLSLAEAQHALAKSYGLKNWRELKASIAESASDSVCSGAPTPVSIAPQHTCDVHAAGIKFGFRYDPMKWIRENRSFQGAVIRTSVLGSPTPEDSALLESKAQPLLDVQKEDGLWPKSHHGIMNHTEEDTAAETCYRLLTYGYSPKHPDIERGIAASCEEQLKNKGELRGYTLQLACQAGWQQGDEPARSMRAFVDTIKDGGLWGGCPWSAGADIATIWEGRHIISAEEVVEPALGAIAHGLNEAGCIGHSDPWSITELAGNVDHPLARDMVIRQMPMILRDQRQDGGWGGVFDRSLQVFRALVRHGLLEPMCQLPALPSDWRVVRHIPVPAIETERRPDRATYRTMAWGDGMLWVYSPIQHAAIGVSPEDGHVLKRIALPADGTFGIGWYKGHLAFFDREPRCGEPPKQPDLLLLMDPATGTVTEEIRIKGSTFPICVGQVNDDLWATDAWQQSVHLANHPNGGEFMSATPVGATNLAATADGVWCCPIVDNRLGFAGGHPLMVKVSSAAGSAVAGDRESVLVHNASVLDWGEKPFGHDTGGLACDGQNLWALDRKNERICLIERNQLSKGE